MINTADLDALRKVNPFHQVAARYLQVAKIATDHGDVYTCACPFCHAHDQTFRIDPITDRAGCTNCFWHGEVIKFICELQDIPGEAAVELLKRAPTSDAANHYTAENAPTQYQDKANYEDRGPADNGPGLDGDILGPEAEQPFRVLGHYRNTFYYHPRGTKEIVSLTATAHTQSNLLNIAPLDHWADHFPHKSKHFDVMTATDALMRRAEKVGVFDIDRLRGRGAWIENGQPVVHMGNNVWRAGRTMSPVDATDFYIYEAGLPLEISLDKIADNKAAHALVRIFRSFDWLDTISADLLAGWCVVAPVCGAIKWRPHIWVSGPSQSGKSTVLDIIKRVVGPVAEQFSGGTTEANVRQTLYHDARPGIFDEFESETAHAADLVQRIMGLARVASDGGKVGKGGKDGKPINYTVRTAFCFTSINPAIVEYADERRISRLVLRKPINDKEERNDKFKALLKLVAEYITQDYSARMFARTIEHLPTLLANIRTFVDAAAATLQNRGAADQLAPMLAGLYLCHSTKAISHEDAVAWIKRHQWTSHTAMEATQDPLRLISTVALTITRVTTTMAGVKDYTVGELIEMGCRGKGDGLITIHEIEKVLGRVGIIVQRPHYFAIANQSPELRKILRGTPWASDWKTTLRGLDCASAMKPEQYSPGLNSRGTLLHVDLLRGRTEYAQADTEDEDAGKGAWPP